jgi:phosphoglycolate phosphatase-like HAD superfamily hydrolase
VLVGDSAWDVMAATAAGLPAIAVQCGGASAAELLDAGAREVYADPADALRRYGDSLLGRLRSGGVGVAESHE